MIQILEYTEGKIIAAKASKTITASDYYKLLPLFINRLKQYPKIGLYIEADDLAGFALEALEEDTEFNAGLASAFDKVALVGEYGTGEWLTELIRSFTPAEVRWFDTSDKDEAREWLKASIETPVLKAI